MKTSRFLLDEKFPKFEQFPRQISFAFIPMSNNRAKILVEPKFGPIRRIRSGICDWTSQGDGYRWYHIFHLSYMTILGWSPISRDLLGLKRRSLRLFEKAEDGARAQIMEEGLCSLIFTMAKDSNYFQQKIPKQIDTWISSITYRYEVAGSPIDYWHHAIREGYRIWMLVCENSGGIVHLDLDEPSMHFRKLPINVYQNQTPENPDSASQKEKKPNLTIKGNYVETFPDKLSFLLTETKLGVVEVFLDLKDGHYINVGSKAEEWSHQDDGFKWHDVFHFSNITFLAWSPVFRSLLHLSRKSVPLVAQHEAGLRPMLLEEAIISLILDEIKKENSYDGSGPLPKKILTYIVALTQFFEVSSLPMEAWEKTISEGYRIWTQIKNSSGGYVSLDLKKRSMSFRGISSGENIGN